MRRLGLEYWNPYVAGIALGIVLLGSFIVAGRGLGASGAFSCVVAAGVQAVDPAHAGGNRAYTDYTRSGAENPLYDWIVLEVLGVIAGGLLSAALAGRLRFAVERGPHAGPGLRLLGALAGGVLMGFGAKLARGCTSGQALSGGALMSVGSWAFMGALFLGAFLWGRMVRREWR